MIIRTASRIIRMNIPRAPRPSRGEWEAGRRRVAEHLIETGEPYYSGGYYDSGDAGPLYTGTPRKEIDALIPDAVRAIRLACGRAERDLRAKHPAAAAVLRDFTYAAEAALTGADKDAYHDLIALRHLRQQMRKDRYYDVDELVGAGWQFARWPQGYKPPASPKLDRLRALYAEDVQRRHDTNVARGRQLLADMESGAVWERELEHRARADEMDST
jgi:hypothetical protein